MGFHTGDYGKIRVLIADNHERFRRGISCVLNHSTDIEVVDSVPHAQATWRATLLQPEVVLFSVNTELLGVELLLRRIQRVSPFSRIIVLTVLEPSLDWQEHVAPHVVAYLFKDVSPADLRATIHQVVHIANSVGTKELLSVGVTHRMERQKTSSPAQECPSAVSPLVSI